MKSGGRVAIRTFRKDWLEQKQVLKLKKIVAGLQARKHKFILRCISFREDETCYYLIEELPANYKSLLELTFECLKSDQLHKIGEAVGSIFNAFKDYPVSESKKNYLTSFFAHPDNFLFEEADPPQGQDAGLHLLPRVLRSHPAEPGPRSRRSPRRTSSRVRVSGRKRSPSAKRWTSSSASTSLSWSEACSPTRRTKYQT